MQIKLHSMTLAFDWSNLDLVFTKMIYACMLHMYVAMFVRNYTKIIDL